MPWLAGGIMLAASIPDHLYPGWLWDAYPAWYHLTYLAYIVPVAWIAGCSAHARPAPEPRSAAAGHRAVRDLADRADCHRLV